jgi:hypothetical protein
MTRWSVYVGVLMVFVLGGCSNKATEPPPPVASAALPPGAPGATGAMAAGLESARPTSPPLADEEPEDAEPPLIPAPAPDDGGVSL